MDERASWIGFDRLQASGLSGSSQICNNVRPMLNAVNVLDALDLTRTIERREGRNAVLSDATKAVLRVESLPVEDIRAQSGPPTERITSALTMMELKGMVRQVGTMN